MSQNSFFNHLSGAIDKFVDRNPGIIGVVAATAAQTLVDIGDGAIGILSGNGAEVADDFDKKVEKSNAALVSLGNKLVDAYPNNTAAVLGATALTAIGGTPMVIGSGYVDSARLGTGFAEGTVTGVAKDVLRALPFLSPAAKISKFINGRIAAAYIDPVPSLGACTPIAITRALAHAGQHQAFMALDAGTRNRAMFPGTAAILNKGVYFEEIVGQLRSIGAKFRYEAPLKTMTEVQNLVRSKPSSSTVAFTVEWVGENTRLESHALYAFTDFAGRFRIGDRALNKAVSSLAELAVIYGKGIKHAQPVGPAMYIPMSRFMSTITQGGELGIALGVVRTVPYKELVNRFNKFINGPTTTNRR